MSNFKRQGLENKSEYFGLMCQQRSSEKHQIRDLSISENHLTVPHLMNCKAISTLREEAASTREGLASAVANPGRKGP